MVAPVIAIDGPSASGKGTVAARVAEALGYHYLDSGALYRLVALAAREARADLSDEAGLARVAGSMDVDFRGGAAWLAGRDVTAALRSEEVGVAASQVAARPPVRAALLERQRALRRPPGLVADGRDMGSIVFPDAPLKVFLTADVGTRAERRYKQLKEKGLSVTLAALLREIQARDVRDAGRAVAPLRPAADAVLIDSTGMPIEAVVATVLALVRPR